MCEPLPHIPHLSMTSLPFTSIILTAKIIEVEPYPRLDFIEKSSKKLAPELRKVLNSKL
mgnify:CR=1 FL=1